MNRPTVCASTTNTATAGGQQIAHAVPPRATPRASCQDLGDEGDIRDANEKGCFPYETCCDGKCCTPNQQCMEVVGTPFKDIQGNLVKPFPFKYGDETIDDINKVARNDWTTDKGRKIERLPRICVDHTGPVMSVSTAMKVIMPIWGLRQVSFFIVASQAPKSLPVCSSSLQ